MNKRDSFLFDNSGGAEFFSARVDQPVQPGKGHAERAVKDGGAVRKFSGGVRQWTRRLRNYHGVPIILFVIAGSPALAGRRSNLNTIQYI
jgi:hypothetical protein